MREKFIKLYVEVNNEGKFSVLYTNKRLQSGILIEGLTKKQTEGVISLLRAVCGDNVFVAGKKTDIATLRVPEMTKIYLDEKFKDFKPLPVWEVL